ncbi:MAG: ATP-binding protein [Pseudomonadota bacterium]
MHPVAVFDIVFFLATLAALISLLKGWRGALKRDAKWLLAGLLFFTLSHSACLALEWFGVTQALDPFEDILGALLPMWWAFLFYAFLRDIAARDLRLSEDRLRESEKGFRELYDEAPVGYHQYDTEGRITSVNQRELEMLGYTAGEMVGKPVWDFLVEKEEARQSIMDKISGLRPPSKGLERTYIRKGGTRLPVLIGEAVITDNKGRLIGIRSSLQDITERKETEREKEDLQDQLLRAQKMEAIGTLAGGVAHDLNNVLSGIVSYPDLLLMQLPQDSPLKKPIKTMQESGKRAAAIVQDLLTLARRGVATTEVVNLNEVVSEYLESPEHEKILSFHPNLQLETNLETDLFHIMGSPVHLSKTVMNLISNSAEAMPGGGKVVVRTENRTIDSPIRGYGRLEEGVFVTLSVSDNGVGISSEDRDKIFEPFYTKKVMGRSGTGLGMAVVWGTVKDHKGVIDVQSTEGKGTTITLYFPVTRKQPVKDRPLASIEEYRGKGETILVVDDAEGQREIASALLSQLGYCVNTVSSGEEAVEYLKNTTVDLMVLDMIMDPGMDGLDTYKQVLEMHPNQKAIIASGFSETARVKEAERLGVGKYIKKPYTLENIGIAVRKEIDK